MADYVMTNDAAKIDEIINQGVKKNVDAVMSAKLEATELKSPIVKTDTLVTVDELQSVDVATLAETNIVNLALGTLPVGDPLIVGRLWNDGGIVTVSAG